MRSRMQYQKWQFKLICADQFFRKRANGIGVKLRIRRGEVDEIIGVRKHREQFAALCMIEESADFLLAQRSGKPLHIVLHEDLHGRAPDRPRALNRHAYAASDGHVRAKKNWMDRRFAKPPNR